MNGLDLSSLLLIILIGRTLGIIFVRFGFQSLIGEVLAGIILSPLILFGFLSLSSSIEAFSSFGILMLLLLSGLFTDFRSFSENKFSSFIIGGMGVLFSIILLFFGTVYLLGIDIIAALFISVILSNTAIEVCSKVMLGNKPSEKVHSVIMGASFVDDIMAVFLIGVLGSVAFQGGFEFSGFMILSFKVSLFLVISLLLIPYIIEKYKLFDIFLKKRAHEERLLLTITILLAVLFAILANYMGLQEVIGAYIAGLIIGKWGTKLGPMLKEKLAYQNLISDLEPTLHALFTPLFFGYVGLTLGNVIFNTPLTLNILYVVILISIFAMAAKYVGCGFGAYLTNFNKKDCSVIGAAMCGRGALEFILIDLGYRCGILSPTLFIAVIIVTLMSIFITPIMYNNRLKNSLRHS